MRIKAEFQIERIASTDVTRQHLCNPFYDVERKRVAATNGHMLVVVPATVDEGDHSGYVTEEAIKAARKVAKKAKGDDIHILLNGTQQVPGGASYPRPSDEPTFPPIDSVIPTMKAGDEGTITIGLSPRYLLDLALALGASTERFPTIALTIKLPDPKFCDAPTAETTDAYAWRHPSRQTFGTMRDPMVVKLDVDAMPIGVLMPARVLND